MLPEQAAKLARPFELHEHKFRDDNVYISKSAIRRRLDEVDPRWTLSPPEHVSTEGDVVIMRGALTVCGVTRYGLGTGIIQRKSSSKNGESKPLEGYALGLMIAKAYKEAASNILPRAAIQFNCGAYIVDLDKNEKPKHIEDVKAMLRKMTHWASGGGRGRASEMLRILGLNWESVAKQIEPDRALAAISETSLTEADFMKRLVEISLKPAQLKSAAAPKPVLDCPIHLLEPKDIIRQDYRDGNNNPQTTLYEVVENWGKVGHEYKLVLINVATAEKKTVMWGGSDQILCDGPKVEAYRKNPALCVKAKIGGYPQWNAQFAATG